MNYTAAFLKQLAVVKKLEEKHKVALDRLQKLCPHVDLAGRSTFPRGLSFTDCTMCGISSHDIGKEQVER